MSTATTNPKTAVATPTSAGAGPSAAALAKTCTDRERFLRACRCQAVDHPPIWMMRQAGRVLPEYRGLKEKYTFGELIRNPELAAEVTLQPIRRFGFDAAILFSDILVAPEAMGQSFRFRETGGVEMEFGIQSSADVARLSDQDIPERLGYVADAIRLIKGQLGGKTALIGFAGSPWTLANFMLEGGSAKEFTRARRLFYTDRTLFDALLEKLTRVVTEFLQMQIDAGVDAIQIFDSLAGVLSGTAFEDASGCWMRRIISSLKGQAPVIVFAKGAHGSLDQLTSLKAQVLGMDWTVRLADLRQRLPATIGIQGNLDPLVLETTPEAAAVETKRILSDLSGRPGHIFNLGHGVPPAAKLECIQSVISTVRSHP